MIENINILDCTLRDGGYYTDWDFDDQVIDKYIHATNRLPIDYIEVGYRNLPQKSYLGRFGYTPVSFIKSIRDKSCKKIAVMLNEKDVLPDDLPSLLHPIRPYIDMVRLAVSPENIRRASILAEAIKCLGLEVGFNTMYMSKWDEYLDFYNELGDLNGKIDVFSMVDSFGGVFPDEVAKITKRVASILDCSIGFHGHDNLQLGLINSITAIHEGAQFVDATILGMGRGAGNLNMELLLTCLSKYGLAVDFNVLGELVSEFQPLYEKYRWGTNLPYMISGAYSIPQKEVMALVTNRAYSFNSIVRGLDNRRQNLEDNASYPKAMFAEGYEEVIVIGGGPSVAAHKRALREMMKNHPSMAIVFVTARHARLFNDLANDKFYCLVGNESKRLIENVPGGEFHGKCILAPYPRKLGTEVPDYALDSTCELPGITFTSHYIDSCTTIALQTAIDMKPKKIYIAGYDGYKGEVLSEKEIELTNENRLLFESLEHHLGTPAVSVTPTQYKSLKTISIYQLI